jgi:hypothetical protein
LPDGLLSGRAEFLSHQPARVHRLFDVRALVVNAIVGDNEIRQDQKHFIEINKALSKDSPVEANYTVEGSVAGSCRMGGCER